MPHRRSFDWNRCFSTIQKYWFLVLPLIFLFPGLFAFPYPSAQAQYSDLAITHFPNAIYLIEAIKTWHTIPLWSPLILSGYPFVANPLAGMWYLPGWLAYLFPLPFGFNLSVAIHLLFGGIGMYRLLRGEGLGHHSALFGALAFEAMPKLFAHYGAGHLTLLYAIPWTPWLLLAWKAPGLHLQARSWVWRVPSGVILAMIFSADVRWAAYSGLLWLGYALTHNLVAANQTGFRALSARMEVAGGQVILAGLLSAPLAFPLLEYMRLSSRAEMAVQDIFTYSLPPTRLLGLVIPDFGGFQEFALYPGMFVLVLSALAILLGVARSRAMFWMWAAGLSLVYAFGDYLPPLSYAARLPGLNLLRVPSRALFISGIALIILASHALERLQLERFEHSPGHELKKRETRLFLAGLVCFVLVLSVGVAWLTKNLPFNFIWSCLMAVGVWVWYELLSGKRLASRYAYWALIVLCMIDLGTADLAAYSPRSAAAVLADGHALIDALPDSDLNYRVYSPSYSIPQQTSGRMGVELADGVDPLQMQSYVDFMRKASGIGWDGYSVTLPVYQGGKPESDNAWAQPDPALLGLLNVRYVVAAFPIDVPGLVLRDQNSGTWIYENQAVLPRAWLQPLATPAGEDAYPVDRIEWSPNRISITATTPDGQSGNQRLVLSELIYPGWQVTVDGKPAQIEPEADILRSVIVAAGTHQIVFTFLPSSLFLGVVAAALGCLLTFWSGSRLARDTWDAGI